MAHPEQRQFCEEVKAKFPEFFKGKQVLDVGSLDINGSNRDLFTDCDYLGIDVGPGRNVDLVCPVHLFPGEEQFDTIISTECFEHDEFWEHSLRRIMSLLVPGGLFLFTCATTGRKEHGTLRTSPQDAPHISTYYRNLTEQDVRGVLDMSKFTDCAFSTNDRTHDLYFYGIKAKRRDDDAWLRTIGQLDEEAEAVLRGGA
jgi:SAM-dependent methyltransferase